MANPEIPPMSDEDIREMIRVSTDEDTQASVLSAIYLACSWVNDGGYCGHNLPTSPIPPQEFFAAGHEALMYVSLRVSRPMDN